MLEWVGKERDFFPPPAGTHSSGITSAIIPSRREAACGEVALWVWHPFLKPWRRLQSVK